MSSEDILRLYASYPFQTDDAYQQGLASLLTGLSTSQSPEDKELFLRRSRVFYFNRVTGNSITLDQAQQAEQTFTTDSHNQGISATSESTGSTSSQNEAQATEEVQSLTFAQLQELIAAGRLDEIPNNKIIPDKLNEEQASLSSAPARKKPWEIAKTSEDNTP
ncbi:hypothetical protein AMATHDRAFT_75135 [Amanita thiersii Skay4041]|uniref:Uncharacterized protein n=1 Tax=Amanita thiersii Skay4041 TaxID=703135 RepID=A0A2A9NJK1_9AGAR|nr:hypothetical protein AMATHDRAFT_75135 [Amanita thiersii Skay4041]